MSVMNQPNTISLKTTLHFILSDINRYRVTDRRSYLAIFIVFPGLTATIYYRLGYWIWHPAEFRKEWLYALRPLYKIAKRLVEVYCGASLSPKARIGRGLYIGSFGSILVDQCVLGENCSLSHEVTIGMATYNRKGEVPVLGDRVFVGAGAKVLGPIKVGNDVAVGANTIVLTSLPDCAVAGGNPAKVLSYKGSFDFIQYRDMENDPLRQKSIYERDLWQPSISQQAERVTVTP